MMKCELHSIRSDPVRIVEVVLGQIAITVPVSWQDVDALQPGLNGSNEDEARRRRLRYQRRRARDSQRSVPDARRLSSCVERSLQGCDPSTSAIVWRIQS
jgi:hypothetical protein